MWRSGDFRILRVAFALGVISLVVGACGSDDGGAGKEKKQAAARCKPGPSGKVAFKSAWKKGDRRSVVVTISKDGKSSSTPASVRVLSVNGKSAHLRWTSGKTALPEGTEAEKAALKDLQDRLGPVTIDYSTDTDGAFEAVDNLPALRSYVRETANALEGLATTAEEKAAFAKSRELMLSDAYIDTLLGDNVGLLHSGYGLEVSKGESLKFPTELPNLFGGDPIRATARVALVTAKDPAGCARAKMDITATNDDLAKALLPSMSKLAGKKVKRSDIAGVSVSQTYRYTYDAGTGWMTRVEFEKRTTTGEEPKVERTVLKLS